jgi:hypothetical protein
MQVFLSNSQVSSICSLKLSCVNNDRYIANASMEGHAFANADGDFLIVPQQGSKLLTIISFLFLCWMFHFYVSESCLGFESQLFPI